MKTESWVWALTVAQYALLGVGTRGSGCMRQNPAEWWRMEAVHFAATLASSEEGRGGRDREAGGLSAGKTGLI